MRHVPLSALILLVTGCATTPVPSASPDVQPATSIIDASAITPREGAGIIIVTRDTGFTAKGCTFDVAIDGKLAAGLKAGQQVTLYADPGERIVGVSTREEYCGQQLAQVAIQAAAGVKKKVRVGVDASLDIRLEPSAY